MRQTNMAKLSHEIISAAIEGFEAQKVRIDAQIAELRGSLSGSGSTETEPSSAPPKRRTMSASARRRIAAAQRKRWAEAKRLAGGAAPVTKTPRRKLSAAGRKRIIEANRKRWALAKAAKKGGQKRAGGRSAAKRGMTAEKSAASQS